MFSIERVHSPPFACSSCFKDSKKTTSSIIELLGRFDVQDASDAWVIIEMFNRAESASDRLVATYLTATSDLLSIPLLPCFTMSYPSCLLSIS